MNLAYKAKKQCIVAALPFVLFTPGLAQTPPPASSDAQQRERVERQLQELQSMKQELQRQMGDFDARIQALEAELQTSHPKEDVPRQHIEATQPPATSSAPPADSEVAEQLRKAGFYETGKGFVLARGLLGELDFAVLAYLRYLNKLGVDDTYTDSFGRTREIQRRQDFQVNRQQIMFRGWLFDERFRYQFWVWTQNSSMGEQTQVNVGGNAMYTFFDWLTFRGGIFSLPTTRSTSQSFPHWIKQDHRTMADEYFRGSYSTAIMLEGTIASGLQYKAALGNNLSTLGVSGAQLDNKLDTFASGLWWMPTTKEFGPSLGFGDYEHHEKLATLLGIHYSRSTESAQSQPDADDFENTQFYLSDGTLLFSPDPFATGGNIDEATYQMVDLEAGLKWKGWSLEGEYYFRLMDNFKTTGPIPVDHVFDHGYQVQASVMVIPKTLQAYVAPSQVFGKYGNPWEVGFGVNWFPFRRKEMRVNTQALYESAAPAGNIALPFSPGNSGWIFQVDMGVWF